MESQHKRLRVALEANGLDTTGDVVACLNRLLNAGKKPGRPPKKEGRGKTPAATSTLHKILKGNIKHVLETKLSPNTIKCLVADLQCTTDAVGNPTPNTFDEVAHALVDGSVQSA